jgi:steroid delta-isomerase-like uncharacterized protein
VTHGFRIPPDNIFGVPAQTTPAVVIGSFIMIGHSTRGRHTVVAFVGLRSSRAASRGSRSTSGWWSATEPSVTFAARKEPITSNDVFESVAQQNRERQRQFVQVLQHEGQLDRVPEFVREDAVDHSLPPGMPDGPDGVRAILEAIRQGFPDHDATVIHIIAEGDLVATYKTFTGTHTGEFFGTPPTGKRATIRVMDFVRYKDGRIAEHWNIVDMAGLMEQLQGG